MVCYIHSFWPVKPKIEMPLQGQSWKLNSSFFWDNFLGYFDALGDELKQKMQDMIVVVLK